MAVGRVRQALRCWAQWAAARRPLAERREMLDFAAEYARSGHLSAHAVRRWGANWAPRAAKIGLLTEALYCRPAQAAVAHALQRWRELAAAEGGQIDFRELLWL